MAKIEQKTEPKTTKPTGLHVTNAEKRAYDRKVFDKYGISNRVLQTRKHEKFCMPSM